MPGRPGTAVGKGENPGWVGECWQAGWMVWLAGRLWSQKHGHNCGVVAHQHVVLCWFMVQGDVGFAMAQLLTWAAAQ